jgi:hypothetical protein
LNLKRDIAAVPWYTSDENYQQFRSIAVDGGDFFETFAEWVQVAMEHEHQAEKAGVILFRVRMCVEDFEKWLRGTRYRNDAEGRSAFADFRANKLIDWMSPGESS